MCGCAAGAPLTKAVPLCRLCRHLPFAGGESSPALRYDYCKERCFVMRRVEDATPYVVIFSARKIFAGEPNSLTMRDIVAIATMR